MRETLFGNVIFHIFKAIIRELFSLTIQRRRYRPDAPTCTGRFLLCIIQLLFRIIPFS